MVCLFAILHSFLGVLGDSYVLIIVTNLGPIPPDSPTLIATTMGPSSSSTAASALHSSHPQKGWNKQNLRPGERSAWTRGRDGWSGVEGSGGVRWVFPFCCGIFSFGFIGFFFPLFWCYLWIVIKTNKKLIELMYSGNLTF